MEIKHQSFSIVVSKQTNEKSCKINVHGIKLNLMLQHNESTILEVEIKLITNGCKIEYL